MDIQNSQIECMMVYQGQGIPTAGRRRDFVILGFKEVGQALTDPDFVIDDKDFWSSPHQCHPISVD
jgi:hypothetical protein